MRNRTVGGFSFVDSIIAVVIVSVAILGMMGALRNIQRNSLESIQITRATQLANNALEVASAKRFIDLESFNTWSRSARSVRCSL